MSCELRLLNTLGFGEIIEIAMEAARMESRGNLDSSLKTECDRARWRRWSPLFVGRDLLGHLHVMGIVIGEWSYVEIV